MRLAFTIPGPPVPKQRARRGKGGRWYTPARTRRYEQHVRSCASVASMTYPSRAVVGDRSGNTYSGWLCDFSHPESCRFLLDVKAYTPTRRRLDLDNVVKSISDALNGIAWPDDSQVARIEAEMAIDRERPRVEVTVEVLDAP